MSERKVKRVSLPGDYQRARPCLTPFPPNQDFRTGRHFQGEVRRPSPANLRGLADLANNRITPDAMTFGLNSYPPSPEDLQQKLGLGPTVILVGLRKRLNL